MAKLSLVVVLLLSLIVAYPSFADDRTKIHGSWRLVSLEQEYQGTGERETTLGKSPTGYMIFTPEGRFMAVLTGEGRKSPNTDQDRADLLKSMFAYTGMYRIEDDKVIVKVDVSWFPGWVGTEQVRSFKVDENRLHIITAWTPHPRKGMARGFLTLEREK
jgi:hypothetical protein